MAFKPVTCSQATLYGITGQTELSLTQQLLCERGRGDEDDCYVVETVTGQVPGPSLEDAVRFREPFADEFFNNLYEDA